MIDKQHIRDVAHAFLMARKSAVRRMLASWVSEIEPEFIYGPGFELLGLGYRDRVVVPFVAED